MKKIILSLILIAPFIIMAQQVKLSTDIKVTKSTPYEVVDAKTKEYVGVKGGFTISVKVDGENVIIQKFDTKTMKEVKRSENEDFPKYAKFQKLIKAGDRLFYVFEALNKKDDNFSVYSREIDIDNAKFKDSKVLFTTKGDVVASSFGPITSFWGMGATPKFSVISSFDGSKILIQFRNRPESKNDSKNYDVLGFFVFDNNFNKIWGKEVKMPHTEKEMNNLAYTVGSDGKVYMLSALNETKSFELITVTNADGLKNKELPVKKGLMFDKFDLREGPTGNIIAAGYYANGTEVKMSWDGSLSLSKNINGIYIFEFTATGNIVKDHDYPFSIDLIKKYLSSKQKDKADKKEDKGTSGINDLVLRNFVLNKDGSIVIIGEVYYSKKEMWMANMQMVSHFGDIVATKIDATGKLVWSDKMPKNQAALTTDRSDIGGLGISYIKGKGVHYILFVDNRKNATLQMDQPSEPHKGGFGGYLTAYKVDDATGKIEKHSILDLTDIGGVKAYQFDVDRIFEAVDKTFMLEVYIKDKQDMMVKMELLK